MSQPPEFAEDAAQFIRVKSDVELLVDTSARLPSWPFRRTAQTTLFEYDTMLSADFVKVLAALADFYADRTVSLLGVDPQLSYFAPAGIYPAFTLSIPTSFNVLLSILNFRPNQESMGELSVELNAFAIAGSSGAWAAWAQRDWAIGLLATPDANGPWRSPDVPWFEPTVDLEPLRAPPGWGMQLTPSDIAAFEANVLARGSG